MARRPATRISVQNGNDFQMWTVIASASARGGLLSQFGPSSWVSRKIVWLMMPHSGLSMNRTDRIVGMDGTAQGRMKIRDSTRIQSLGTTKKPDKASATAIFTLMAIRRN